MANEVGQPHLVSLVLQSKKALQHGEQLCNTASSISTQSAQTAVDVLALDAKVRWMTDAVLEQLKLAAGAAKIIEQKRMQLDSQAKEWDDLRNQRTGSLDAVLDSLGAQFVPPDFYSTSPVSSLFGSQSSSEDEADEDKTTGFKPGQSPTETLRDVLRNGIGQRRFSKTRDNDRSHWKTLRDFVDERSIEDLLDAIEADRNVLDDILAKTSSYPEQLADTISAIRSSLPVDITIPPMDDMFSMQESVSTEMAGHLHSLTGHYDQMAQALHDSEAGEIFSEDDLQEMHRDTDELPAIIADLEKNIASIRASHEQLQSAKRVAQEQLGLHKTVLGDLDSLGDIITDILDDQQNVENEYIEQLSLLDENLVSVEELHTRYTRYQYSYCKLVIELARRKQYAEAAGKIVETMTAQLNALVEEERQTREDFNAVHGEHLPTDVYPSMQNPPTRYEILPWHQDTEETLPCIDRDLLTEAITYVARADGTTGGSQSL